MELPQDPYMLLSMINMKLRDGGFDSFEQMCETLDLDSDEITQKLGAAGFTYQPAPVNQFK